MIPPTHLPVPAPPARSLLEHASDGGAALSDDPLRPGDLFARFWIASFAVALLALTASARETDGPAR